MHSAQQLPVIFKWRPYCIFCMQTNLLVNYLLKRWQRNSQLDWLQVVNPMPHSRSSSTDKHHMQLHLDSSCNHWFVKPSQCPVYSKTCGTGRQYRSRPWSQERHHITTVFGTHGFHFRLRNRQTASTEVSLMTGISVTLMPEPTWCSPAVQTSSSAGNATGPGTSALRWPSYTLAILHCWQDISIKSGAGTLPAVHIPTVPRRRQSSVQPTIRPKGTSGLEENLTTPVATYWMANKI